MRFDQISKRVSSVHGWMNFWFKCNNEIGNDYLYCVNCNTCIEKKKKEDKSEK